MNSTKNTLQKTAGVFQIIVGIVITIIGTIAILLWQVIADFFGDVGSILDTVGAPGGGVAAGLGGIGYFLFLLIIGFGITMIVLGGKLTANPINNLFNAKALIVNPSEKPIKDKLGVSIATVIVNLLFLLTAIGTGFNAWLHLAPLLITVLAGIALFLKHPENSPEAIKAKIEAQKAAEAEQKRIQKQKDEEKEQALKMQQQQQMQFQQMMQLQMQNMFTQNNQFVPKNNESQPKQTNEPAPESALESKPTAESSKQDV
ncbi:MAG: hypothetical protein LBT30_04555 [Clostridiales bacterium]|jgi:hypothetical protein|nr:hypothetical protein [Clostridiales bacterium]